MLKLDMYITTLPVILAGVFNMVFTKTRLYQRHKAPIDHYRRLADGKRLFGGNKTWAGFFSMIVLCMAAQLAWGLALKALALEAHNELYRIHANQWGYNLLAGFLFGLAYMLFELPNSFVKRRLGIPPGGSQGAGAGPVFFVVDQIDSLIGVAAVIYFLADISFLKYLGYIALGGVTHAGVNWLLLKMKVRRNL